MKNIIRSAVLSAVVDGGWVNGVEKVVFVFQVEEEIEEGEYKGQRKIFTIHTSLNSQFSNDMIHYAGRNKKGLVTKWHQYKSLLETCYDLQTVEIIKRVGNDDKITKQETIVAVNSCRPQDRIESVCQELPFWMSNFAHATNVMIKNKKVQ